MALPTRFTCKLPVGSVLAHDLGAGTRLLCVLSQRITLFLKSWERPKRGRADHSSVENGGPMCLVAFDTRRHYSTYVEIQHSRFGGTRLRSSGCSGTLLVSCASPLLQVAPLLSNTSPNRASVPPLNVPPMLCGRNVKFHMIAPTELRLTRLALPDADDGTEPEDLARVAHALGHVTAEITRIVCRVGAGWARVLHDDLPAASRW